MYRFLIFGYVDYYPSGGMDDCIGKIHDVSDVITLYNENKEEFDTIEIYDCREDKIYYEIDKLEDN